MGACTGAGMGGAGCEGAVEAAATVAMGAATTVAPCCMALAAAAAFACCCACIPGPAASCVELAGVEEVGEWRPNPLILLSYEVRG